MHLGRTQRVVCLALLVACTGTALAELQNVQVGGEIRILSLIHISEPTRPY